jgi:hypothetical protein
VLVAPPVLVAPLAPVVPPPCPLVVEVVLLAPLAPVLVVLAPEEVVVDPVGPVLLELVVEDDVASPVSDFEQAAQRKPAPSNTIDTLRRMRDLLADPIYGRYPSGTRVAKPEAVIGGAEMC